MERGTRNDNPFPSIAPQPRAANGCYQSRPTPVVHQLSMLDPGGFWITVATALALVLLLGLTGFLGSFYL